MNFKLTIFLLTLGLLSCESRSQEAPIVLDEVSGPKLESWDVELNVLKQSKPRYHIVAGYQAQFEQGDSSYSLLLPSRDREGDPVEITLFDEEGLESGTLSALEILYYDKKGRIEAKSEVRLLGKDQKILTSEYLTWSEESRKVSTTGFVTIDSPNEKLQGYDLLANEDLSEVEIKNLTGIVRLSN